MKTLNGVIYCRVSSEDQLKGYSLQYQEKECRLFAQRNNINVIKIFIERGESAKTANRPEIQKLLKFIAQNKNEIDHVIVHKIDRLSRNLNDTSNFRVFFSKLDIELKSATENIDNTPLGNLMANVLASWAQFDNDIRAERTVKGMIEALKEGRWVHKAQIGYVFKESPDGRKNLYQDENAIFIKKAFNYFNKGIYKQAEIIRKLKNDGFKEISKQLFNKIIRNPIYAGIINNALLNEPVKGTFKPIISEEDFYKAQSIINSKNPLNRKRLRENPDFPLRNTIICPYCGKPLTGSWSKGKTKKYAYYHCNTKGCKLGNVRKEELENVFINTLKDLEPSEEVLDLFDRIIIDIWNTKQNESLNAISKFEGEIRNLNKRKKKILDLLIKGTLDDKTYKSDNNDIDGQITVRKMQINELKIDYQNIEFCINYCKHFLKNISKLWITSNISLKIKFQNIIFPEGTVYFNGTLKKDKISTIFKVLKPETEKESTMVAPK